MAPRQHPEHPAPQHPPAGREAELRIHLNGALNLGIEREKLEAVLTHVAHYAGWPVAVSGFRVLEEVCAAREAGGDE